MRPILLARFVLLLRQISDWVRALPDLSKQLASSFWKFLVFFAWYNQKKILLFSHVFEKNKNLLVRFFMVKRGRYSRPFLHITAMGVLWIGVFLAPYLADTYPVFSKPQNVLSAQTDASEGDSIIVDSDVFETKESQKPRDKVVAYVVQKGDTLSTIAEKFGISEDTIRWENDLTSDDITVGDELRILPVTGILHKVVKGESVYTIAKKYDTNPQGIVDFPFNDFANPQTFTLVEGQMVVVPEGVKPEEQPTYVRPRQLATGPIQVLPSGFAWPTVGSISQYYAWYHPGIDIATDVGTPIVAATNGTVSEVYTGGWNGGYGIYVVISGANGSTTLYAHMSGVNVSLGQEVLGGKTTIGWVGLTGRTTGAHLHFEVRTVAGSTNPLAVLGR